MSRLDEIKARYDWKYAGLIADDFNWLIVELEKAREELCENRSLLLGFREVANNAMSIIESQIKWLRKQ